MKRNRLIYAGILTLTAFFTACNSNPEWKVKGTVEGGEGKFITLEASNNGTWYMLDTLTLKADGRFDFKQPAAGYPDIYRLTVDGNSLYFPVDSIETITIKTDIANFSNPLTIDGSSQADMFMQIDAMVNDAVKRNGSATNAVADADLKQKLAELILSDPSSVTAYYAINKKIGATPLYSASNRNDLRIIGAVANAFDIKRPTDPRTMYLKRLFLSNRAPVSSVPTDTIVANEVNLIDIELLDPAGKTVKLSDVASKGNVVILNFTSLTAKESPVYNLELGKIYESRHANGLEIYQVSIDDDEFAWRQAAKNLPWISVYNNPSDLTPLIRYNVGALPVSFIIDRNGSIAERVVAPEEINKVLNKYM